MESQHLDLQTLRSRIDELSNFLQSFGDKPSPSPADPEKFIDDWVQAFQTKVDEVVAEHSDVGSFKDEDLDAYTDRLRDELRMAEAESASVRKKIESLEKSYVEGTCQLESNIQTLRHAVDCAESQGQRGEKAGENVDGFKDGDGPPALLKAHGDNCFEIFNLKHQIEMKQNTLKSLQNLDFNLKRVEAIEKIQEALTGLKVIDFEGNCIRVSLRTYIPNFEGLMCQQTENDVKLSEVNHELLIEVMDGTMELKHAEIFPNDVYIGDVVEATNSYSNLISMLPQTRSTLGWFLQKVRDKIIMCNIRQLMVKMANKSRHSFEYLDKDELIIAHVSGGVDAYIKPSQGWPLLPTSALKLVSLKSSDQNAKEISLSLLCKVEEVANSLDFDIRKSITDFVNGIEEILLEKMRSELQPNNILP